LVPRMRRSSGGTVKLSIQLRLLRRLRSSCDCTKLRKTVYSFSILSPIDSSSPSSTSPRGSRSPPRSPTLTPSPSTTSTGTRTRQCFETDKYPDQFSVILSAAYIQASQSSSGLKIAKTNLTFQNIKKDSPAGGGPRARCHNVEGEELPGL